MGGLLEWTGCRWISGSVVWSSSLSVEQSVLFWKGILTNNCNCWALWENNPLWTGSPHWPWILSGSRTLWAQGYCHWFHSSRFDPMPCSNHKYSQGPPDHSGKEPQENNQLLSRQPVLIPHRPSYIKTSVITIVFDSSSGFYEDTVTKNFTCIPPWGYINRYCGIHWPPTGSREGDSIREAGGTPWYYKTPLC
jgi:hypothetical protein